MTELEFTFPTIAVIALLAGAAAVRLQALRDRRDHVAVVAAIVALIASIGAARDVLPSGGRLAEPGPWSLFAVDPFTVMPMVLFSALVLLTVVMAPVRDRTPAALSATLALGAGTLMTYAADHLAVLWIGAALSAAPLWWSPAAHDEPGRLSGDRSKLLIIAASVVLLGAGLVLFALGRADADPRGLAMPPLAPGGAHGEHRVAFILLFASAILRGAIFPFHGWVIRAMDRGPLLTVLLVVNAQVGIFVAARVAAPIAPATAQAVFPLFGILALATAVYVSFGALGERAPRRVIARMLVSQSAVMQAALTSATAEGVSGALLHWTVISVAATGLVLVCRAVEVRIGGLPDSDRLLGLGERFPRFAVFFAGFGLAVAGLPGTLGFCSEDLLLHGALETNPFIAIALPVATALNAFQIFRLFSRVFLGGRASDDTVGVPDALPRERWVLSALLVFLVVSGLAPSTLVRLHVPAAELLVQVHQTLHE
jgi:NADH-quinone oxidoreductase subunit M